MKRLSDILEQKRSFARPQIPKEPFYVNRAAQKISRRWPNAEAVETESDAEALASEMNRRRRDDDWRKFYWADATQTASAFLGDNLSRDNQFADLLKFILFQIGKGSNFTFLRVMFRKYLEIFDPKSTLTQQMAEKLKQCWRETGLPIDQLVRNFRIFDIDSAPHLAIARHMNAERDPFHALREEGLEAPHGTGLMRLAHQQFVSMLKPRIANGEYPAAQKMLEWLNPGGDCSPLQGLGAGAAIDALLRPWNGRDPVSDMKDLIETGLTKAYGDLRVNSAGAWSACSDEARRVILRWLVGATIKVFFNIVTEADKTHMWDDRKSLWIYLYEENRITEAWFALSPPGEEIADRFSREKEKERLAFARNESTNSQDRNKCLLIMRVDGQWVVEGSHNFATRVFPPGDLSKLKPYENSYTCEQIRSISRAERADVIVHHRNWHNKVLTALQS